MKRQYLIDLRKTKKFNQSEIGLFVGVSRQSVASWEEGSFDFGISMMIRLALAFGADICDFMNYEREYLEKRKKDVK